MIEGDGSATFDFIHVKDVAWANILAMMSGFEEGIFNISTGIGTTIKDLVEMLIAHSPHKENQIVYKEERNGDRFVTKRIGSTELAYEKLGFRAKISLEEGLLADTYLAIFSGTLTTGYTFEKSVSSVFATISTGKNELRAQLLPSDEIGQLNDSRRLINLERPVCQPLSKPIFSISR